MYSSTPPAASVETRTPRPGQTLPEKYLCSSALCLVHGFPGYLSNRPAEAKMGSIYRYYLLTFNFRPGFNLPLPLPRSLTLCKQHAFSGLSFLIYNPKFLNCFDNKISKNIECLLWTRHFTESAQQSSNACCIIVPIL